MGRPRAAASPDSNAAVVTRGLLQLDIDRWLEAAATALTQQGWFCDPTAVPPALTLGLRADLDELLESDLLRRAGIGRENDYQLDRNTRADRIFWLDRSRPLHADFLAEAEKLRLALNRRLFLALFEFEAHLALYPPGAFYRRHYDSFRGSSNRMISLVLYLNQHWRPGDGGELVLYSDDQRAEPMARIEPRAGTVVLFLSEEIPHEVLPTGVERASVSGWYRLNSSTANAIDPPR
ncbi:MAG: 2OG-Fe(II) oxygenase [Wenzhouxiangellaceae bacterium]|nr:2OG-Fe(II) oxygenase [Wenzhouxiangellaceae bacterium]